MTWTTITSRLFFYYCLTVIGWLGLLCKKMKAKRGINRSALLWREVSGPGSTIEAQQGIVKIVCDKRSFPAGDQARCHTIFGAIQI
jgi:hypothetical protein